MKGIQNKTFLSFYPYSTHTFVPADVLVLTQAGLEVVVKPQEKVAGVLWLAKLKSMMAVQHNFRSKDLNPLHRRASGFGTTNQELKWDCYVKKLLQSQGPLKRCKSHQTGLQVQSAYIKSDASSQLQILHLTAHNVQHKHLHLRAYNFHLLEALKLNDWVKCTNFVTHAGENWHYKMFPAKCASHMRWPFKLVEL